MNCETVQGLLSEFVDDELAPQARGDVAAHLAACSVCAVEHTLLRKLGDATRAHFSRTHSAASAVGSVASGPTLDSVRRAARWHGARRMVVAAAAVLLVAMVLVHFRPLGPSEVIASSLSEAAARALDQSAWLEIDIRQPRAESLPSILRFEAKLTLGPNGQVLLRTAGFLPPLPGASRMSVPFVPPGKSGWLGSDGTIAWRWIEGLSNVQWIDLNGQTLEQAFRAAMPRGGRPSDLQDQSPFGWWTNFHDLLEAMRAGRSQPRVVREEQIDRADVTVYELGAETSDGRPHMRTEVSVDRQGSIRQIKLRGVTINLRRLATAPSPDAFRWQSYAPSAAPLKAN